MGRTLNGCPSHRQAPATPQSAADYNGNKPKGCSGEEVRSARLDSPTVPHAVVRTMCSKESVIDLPPTCQRTQAVNWGKIVTKLLFN